MRSHVPQLAALAVLAVLPPATVFCSEWSFLPVGKDASASYASPDVDEAEWYSVQMPHSTWDDLQPTDSVYGWYRLHFVADPHFAGTDMVLKLGIVDDADETYCNGKLIGSTGGMPPNFRTAYNVDREYVIPADVINYGGDNTIAVKVFDTIGTGGVLGAPRLGYRLANADGWSFRAAGKDYDSDLSAVDVNHDEWDQVPMPEGAWDELQPGDDTCGWYRLRFTAPSSPEHTPMLDLGIVLDADETFINGQLIGSTGGFPPHAAEAGAEPRVYSVPDGIINWSGENVLAVKVFNGSARGGIWGRPAWLHRGTDDAPDPLARGQSALAAGDWQQAASAFEAALATAENEHTIGDALDGLAVALTELGRDDEALKAFTRLMSEYPAESCSLAAVRAVQSIQGRRGALSEECFFLGEDRVTQGDWWLRYGNSGFVLSAMGGDCDIFGEPGWCAFVDPVTDEPLATPPFEFEVSTLDAQRSHHYNWRWAASTSDRRALQNPLTGARTATCVDDKGEEHPFDNEGPDLRFEMQVPEGWHRVAFYMVDWDWWNTWHPRVQSIVLMDADGTPLSVADTGKFGQGVWLQFAVRGPRAIIARISKHRSINAVLSGAFLDATRLPPSYDLLGVGTTGEVVPRLRAAYERVAVIGPELREGAVDLRAELDAVVGDEALPTSDAVAVAWMRWGLASVLQEGVAEAGADFITALQEAAGDAHAEELAGLEETLRDDRRFDQASVLMTALGAAWKPAVGRGDEAVIADLAPRLATWAEIDAVFASEMLTDMLAATEPLPVARRAGAIVDLGATFVDQDWRMPRCRRRGERPLLHQAQQEPPSVPSLAARVEDALLAVEGLEGPECPERVVAFARGRAEKADAVSRALFRAGGSPEGCEVALRGVQLARLVGLPEDEGKLLWIAVALARGQRPLIDRTLALVDYASTAVLTVVGLAGELELCGDLEAGADLLELALERGGARPDRERLRLARARAGLLERMGRGEDARALLMGSVVRIATLEDEQVALELARALRALGSMYARIGDAEGLRQLRDFATRISADTALASRSGLTRELTVLDEALRRTERVDEQGGEP